MEYHIVEVQDYLGATSTEKIPKISASGQIF